jgi:hypothetical protein
VTKLAGDAAHGDRDADCQDGVTKVACGAAHGDGDVGCQDGMMKVTCGAVHGGGDTSCHGDAAKLAAEAMGSDRNPSYPIPDGVHGIQVATHVQVQCAEGVCLILWVKKNQIRNNKISRDVKGLSSRCLVLGQVYSVFKHPSCCSSRTSCLSRRGVVSGPKEAHGGLRSSSHGPSKRD